MRLDALVNEKYDQLTANDREMLETVRREKESVRGMNSTELAALLHVSRTTVVRMIKKLGLCTFADFKLLLEQEEPAAVPGFDLQMVVKNYHSMIDELKKNDYRDICRMLDGAGTIYLYGTGNEQKAVAEEFKRIFLIFGKCCIDLFDFGEVESASRYFRRGDLFLAISLSGETPEALRIIRYVLGFEIRTISLTRWENNSLARLCHENLYVGTRRVLPENSRSYEMVAAFYIMLDMLSVRFLEYRREKEKGGESREG